MVVPGLIQMTFRKKLGTVLLVKGHILKWAVNLRASKLDHVCVCVVHGCFQKWRPTEHGGTLIASLDNLKYEERVLHGAKACLCRHALRVSSRRARFDWR